MSLVMPPLVQETTTTTGTGTYDLSETAPTGRQTFANAVADGQMSDGDQVYYMVIDASGGPPDFEHGIGTYTAASPDTLSRDVILASSNSGSAVSWGVGTRDVYVVGPQPVERPLRTVVYKTSVKSVAGGSSEMISWGGEIIDEANAWASSPNPTRITVPSGYQGVVMTAQVNWSATADTDALFHEFIGDGLALVPRCEQVALPNGVSAPWQQIVSPKIDVSAISYLELRIHNTSTNARSINGTLAGSGTVTWWEAVFSRE